MYFSLFVSAFITFARCLKYFFFYRLTLFHFHSTVSLFLYMILLSLFRVFSLFFHVLYSWFAWRPFSLKNFSSLLLLGGWFFASIFFNFDMIWTECVSNIHKIFQWIMPSQSFTTIKICNHNWVKRNVTLIFHSVFFLFALLKWIFFFFLRKLNEIHFIRETFKKWLSKSTLLPSIQFFFHVEHFLISFTLTKIKINIAADGYW